MTIRVSDPAPIKVATSAGAITGRASVSVGPPGSKGDKGDQGPKGDRGDPGPGGAGSGITAANSDSAEPTRPSAGAALVPSLVFTDTNGLAAFAVDAPGTATPRVRRGDVVYPSGDPTGATDLAALNAALATYGKVTMAPGTWKQNGSIVVPSGKTLVCEGPIQSTLVAGSNSNLITNDISTATGTSISVLGRGPVKFDGNAINQVKQTADGWKNVGVHFVNVDGLRVEGLTWQNTAMFGALMTGVRNAFWHENRVEQDLSVPNQDGLDIGPGCHDVWIDGLTGNTEDDVHSIFAKFTTSQNTIHTLYKSGGALYSAAGNDTHDIHISRSHVNAGKNYLRLQAAEGSKLYDIYATDLEHTGTTACRAAVIFGEMIAAYTTAPPAVDGSDFHDIVIDGFKGRVLSLVYADSNFRDATVRNAHLTSWGALVSERDSTDTPAQFSRLVIDGVTSGATAAADTGNLVTLTAGMVMKDSALRNIDLAAVKRIIANTSSTLTNVEIDALVGSISTGAFFASAAVGNTAARLDVRCRTAVADWGTPPTIGAAVDRFSLEGV